MDPTKDKKPRSEQADWVMSFIARAEDDRAPFIPIWDETEQNFLVRPPHDTGVSQATNHPLMLTREDGRNRGNAILKDPETHQEMMTLVSSIVLALFPREGFLKGKGKGFEDIAKATTVTELLHHTHRLPGQFWEFMQWILRTCVYGTSILEVFYDYIEEPRTIREIDFDPETGLESSDSYTDIVPVWDDVRYIARDHRDFYPDPGADTIPQMRGAAMHDKVDAREAKRLGRQKIYNRLAVKNAIAWTGDSVRQNREKTDDEIAGTHQKRSHPDFMEMDRYRYVGFVPWKSDDGIDKREIVIVGGEVVRDEPWPRRLPWFECGLIPRPGGSFWRVAPAEIIRFDQDFVDTVKMMLADAVVRMVHPSPIVSDTSGIRREQWRQQRPDRPIVVEGDPRLAVAWPDYNPPIQPAFGMWDGTKQHMRQATSALGSVQGLGLGSKRFSATEAQQTQSAAAQRPELFARVIEQEYLPQVGKYTLELYQEFLDDTDELRMRVGDSSTGAVLNDILATYDIEYVGSRQLSEQQEIEAFREIVQLGANPAIAPLIPWIAMLRKHFRRIGADEVAVQVGNPQIMKLHVMLSQLVSPTAVQGNGNGEVQGQPPVGALPAQLAGGTVQ